MGKMLGAAVAAMISLIGVLAMIFVMQIPMDPGDLLRVLVLAPILAVAGGALGVLFIGFVQDPKVAGLGVVLLVFPQMFLSGALIPSANSTGLLGRPVEADADDLQHRPRAEHLLRGQARVRVHACSTRSGSTLRSPSPCASCSSWSGPCMFVRRDRNR